MKTKIVLAAIAIAVLFGASGALAVNEYLVFDYSINDTGAVTHTWVCVGDSPHRIPAHWGILPEGGTYSTWANTTGSATWTDNNSFGEWSNITVWAYSPAMNDICNGTHNVFVPTPYSPDPIPFSLWVSLLAFGAVLSIIACVYVKNLVIAVPLGTIGVISFIFGGNMVTTNGIAFYSGGTVVNTVSDVLVSQIVMLFAIFPLLIVIVSIVRAVYAVLDDKQEQKLSEFDDQWG